MRGSLFHLSFRIKNNCTTIYFGSAVIFYPVHILRFLPAYSQEFYITYPAYEWKPAYPFAAFGQSHDSYHVLLLAYMLLLSFWTWYPIKDGSKSLCPTPPYVTIMEVVRHKIIWLLFGHHRDLIHLEYIQQHLVSGNPKSCINDQEYRLKRARFFVIFQPWND